MVIWHFMLLLLHSCLLKNSEINSFLGKFAKLRKETHSSSFLPVCETVRMEQLGLRWTNFHKMLYLKIFRKFIERVQVLLTSDMNNRCFMWKPMYIMISPWILLRIRTVLDKFVEELETHILCSITFSENRAVYKITLKIW
jgi:hypothetical protein